MGVASPDLKLRFVVVGRLDVHLLTDVSSSRGGSRPRDGGSARAVEGIGDARQPPRVIAAIHAPFCGGPELDAGSGVVNVPPSDLVGQAVLVVAGGIQLIESPARPVRAIPVARRVVVFTEE